MYVIITWVPDATAPGGGRHETVDVFVMPGEKPETSLEEKLDVLRKRKTEVRFVIWKHIEH